MKSAIKALPTLHLCVCVLLSIDVLPALAQDASLQVEQFLNAFRGKPVAPIAAAPTNLDQSASSTNAVVTGQAPTVATPQDTPPSALSCPQGMTSGPGGCIPMAMPANAHRVSPDGRWECDGGYTLSNASCFPAQAMPENAHLTGTGAAWDCNTGYRRAGNACVQIHLPANAHLAATWNGWACDSGFQMVGNWCVAH